MGECDSFKVRDKDTIVNFIESLIREIEMKQFGEVITERFALDNPEVAGYSAMCFLTTSHISAHFAEKSNSVFLDIFTCSKLDVNKTVIFCMDFFQAKTCNHTFRLRYLP
jgi:S-adenosylmethionine/arginine decarboxylase-like enzyme